MTWEVSGTGGLPLCAKRAAVAKEKRLFHDGTASKGRQVTSRGLISEHWLLGFGFNRLWSCANQVADGNEPALRRLFFENLLAIERHHASVFGLLFHFGIARANLFFASVLGNAQLVERGVGAGVDVLFHQLQLVGRVLQADILAAGKDLMASMLVVPLGEGGRHVHLLDDVPPAHASVVRAERDFAFLRGVRNDALLGAAEVVVEEVLEPHTGDEQEVPTIFAALLDIFE